MRLKTLILPFVLAAAVAAVAWIEWKSPVIRDLVQGAPVELVLLGLDDDNGARRADAIFLVRLDSRIPAVKIMQIPRDLATLKKPEKINALLARHIPEAGRLIKKTLAEAMGQSPLDWAQEPVRYLSVDALSFMRLAGAFGLVAWPGESLNPEEALGVVRERDERGDWGRMAQHKAFLSFVARQLLREPWRIPLLVIRWNSWKRSVETNFNAPELAALAVRLRAWMSPAHCYFFQLPTVTDARGRLRLDAEAFGEMLPFWTHDGPAAARPALSVEILNASMEPGLALRFTRHLRRQDPQIDVLHFGNAPVPSASSFLILRQSQLRLAKELLIRLNRKTGLEANHLIAPAKRRGVQFSVLLGEDANGLPHLKPTGPLEHL